MTKSRSKKASKSVFQNPGVVIAVITGTLGLLGTLIAKWPGPERTELPTFVVSVSTPIAITPTQMLPDIESPIPFTATLPVTLSETPAPNIPTLACLSDWIRVDTGQLPTPTAIATTTPGILEECPPILDLGISIESKELIFSKKRERDTQGLFGISHRIDNGYLINLKVTSSQLFNAEFWVAVSTEKIADIPNDVVTIVLIPETESSKGLTGTIAIYRNGKKVTDKKWTDIINIAGAGRPFIYSLNIRVARGSVIITINGREVANEIGIFPNYLFLGYNKKSAAGSALVDVRITDLNPVPVK